MGQHLAACLIGQEADVYGFDRRAVAAKPQSIAGAAHVLVGDLSDPLVIRQVVDRVQPTHIFHLAGVLGGAPGGSAEQYRVNVLGTVHLLDALLDLSQHPRVLIASSSAVYGAATGLPIDEGQPYRPLTPYAASKAAQELVGLQAFLSQGIPVALVRTFNLVGPGQSRALVASELAFQIAQAEVHGYPSVQVGNLTPRRDYTDVRDAVRANVLLASVAEPGRAYNVCSGLSRSVQECADILLALAHVPLTLEPKPGRARSIEILDQVGDPTRIYQTTGWRPEIPLETSLRDLLDDWRRQVALNKEEI